DNTVDPDRLPRGPGAALPTQASEEPTAAATHCRPTKTSTRLPRSDLSWPTVKIIRSRPPPNDRPRTVRHQLGGHSRHTGVRRTFVERLVDVRPEGEVGQ